MRSSCQFSVCNAEWAYERRGKPAETRSGARAHIVSIELDASGVEVKDPLLI